MISTIRNGVSNRVRRLVRSPFRSANNRQIVHCTYHKMGTKWFTSVLAAIADHYGLTMQCINDNIEELQRENEIIVLNHSDRVAQDTGRILGSHMIRDFRDVVVSGYFYHLWTDEEWANIPKLQYENQSYQQFLNGLSQEDGIAAEIKHLAEYLDLRKIRDWNFSDPRFLELKYEDVFGNEREAFQTLFDHYGFTPEAIRVCLKMADSLSFNSIKKKREKTNQKSHLRSGKSGQWQQLFSEKHKQLFKEQLGDVLVVAGYEKSLDW